jgi:hypothetical protein
MADRMNWEQPKILHVHSLPDVTGDCIAGSTDIGTACGAGQDTKSDLHTCSTGTLAGPGLCTTGTQVVPGCGGGSTYSPPIGCIPGSGGLTPN